MTMEDFDKPIEMAFLNEAIDKDTYDKLNPTQQYIYTNVRVLRNRLKLEHLNELIDVKQKAINDLARIRELAGA